MWVLQLSGDQGGNLKVGAPMGLISREFPALYFFIWSSFSGLQDLYTRSGAWVHCKSGAL